MPQVCLSVIYSLLEILTSKTHTQPLLPELCFASSVDISKTVRKTSLATRFHLFGYGLSLIWFLFWSFRPTYLGKNKTISKLLNPSKLQLFLFQFRSDSFVFPWHYKPVKCFLNSKLSGRFTFLWTFSAWDVTWLSLFSGFTTVDAVMLWCAAEQCG